MSSSLKPRFTVDQYLSIERASAERHCYLDGEIYSMAGESGEHGDITSNLVIALGTQLKGKPCRVRSKDTKVRSGPTLKAGETTHVLFSYPDIVVVCGKPEYLDGKADVILNPTAIIEALSPSTEAFDRGEKFNRYQSWNPTLMEYLLVSQDAPKIEQFVRQKDNTWSYSRVMGLENSVTISSIGCVLKLSDVFERVEFDEQPE